MKEFFALIYDTLFGIFNQDFDIIYTHLFDNGGYTNMGLIFIITPFICGFLFYFFWKDPYCKLLHWIIWLLISIFLVFFITIYSANSIIFDSNNQALNDALTDSSFIEHAKSLPLKYSLINGFLALILGFVYSIILKRFSKIQTHLPF